LRARGERPRRVPAPSRSPNPTSPRRWPIGCLCRNRPLLADEAAAAIRAPSRPLIAARAADDADTSPQHPAAPEPAVKGRPHDDAAGQGHLAPIRRQQPRPAAARSRHRPGQRAANHRSSRPHAPAHIRLPARTPRSRTLIISGWIAGDPGQAPHRNPTSPRPGAPPQTSHGHDGISLFRRSIVLLPHRFGNS
jgi:hypothetical protein